MDRRQFLASASLVAVGLAIPQSVRADSGSQLRAVLDAAFWGDGQLSPESLTSQGLDEGHFAWARHTLNDYGAQGAAARAAHASATLARLSAIPDGGLDDQAMLQRDVAIHMMEMRLLGPKYDLPSIGSPFVVDHRRGIYANLPVLLDTRHPVQTSDDAEAYLDRLAGMEAAIADETEFQIAQAGRGYLPPGWSLDMAANQIERLISPAAAHNNMVASLHRRATENGISGDWAGRATRILETQVYPAFNRQAEIMRDLTAGTPEGDGIWRVPRGDEIYADTLRYYTTTTLTPDEVHEIGLEQVAALNVEIDPLLRKAGLSKGSVGERLAELGRRPDQLYANTSNGKAELLRKLNDQTDALMGRLSEVFATVPTQPVEIRAVPEAIQEGASAGYYTSPTLDGSQPGIFWINLRTTANWPKFFLAALSYHEGVPGHHLHSSLRQQSEDLPLLLKRYSLSAYSEGWALYAEQLANEIGGYEGIEQLGRLQSWLYRATRLVTDTGLHHKRWDIEKAAEYFQQTIGLTRDRSLGETRRYCVLVAQACSYKIGLIKWLELRAKAESALGPRFDLGRFHDILLDGVMPLTMLENRVDRWIANEKGRLD